MKQTIKKWAAPVLATIGLLDSGYLTITHILGDVPVCAGYAGCAAVTSSPYSEIFGIPVAFFGSAAFLVMLGLAVTRIGTSPARHIGATTALFGIALASAVFMLYLTSVELLVLHDYCYWCLTLAATTLLMLGVVTREYSAMARPEPVSSRRRNHLHPVS